MTERQKQALKNVVDYMLEDEQVHYNECETEDQHNHIYNDLLILKDMVEIEDEAFNDYYARFLDSIKEDSNISVAMCDKGMIKIIRGVGYTKFEGDEEAVDWLKDKLKEMGIQL